MADKFVFYNNYRSTLAGDILAGATSLSVTDAGDLATPAAGFALYLTLSDSENVEIVEVTAVSGTTLTVVRAQESTTAQAWGAGTTVSARITAAMLGNFAQVDPSGNARGTNALDLQSGRDADANVASGAESFAAGFNNKAAGGNSAAIGSDNDVGGWGAVAVGSGNVAPNGGAAVGGDNTASGANAVAAGQGNVASGYRAIAAGYYSTASASRSVAIGDACEASGAEAVAVGHGSTSSAYAVAIGSAVTAAAQFSVCAGANAVSEDPSTLDAWAATTGYGRGSKVRLSGSADYILYCVKEGTSAAMEPDMSGVAYYGGPVADGSVIWNAIQTLGTSQSAASLGTSAYSLGRGAVALGYGADAYGMDASALGYGSVAIGARSVAVGGNAATHGRNAVCVGSFYGRAVDGRELRQTVGIGSQKYIPFNYARSVAGMDFIGEHDWFYEDQSGDLFETGAQTTGRMALHSIPIQLGDAGHPGASTTVKHGYSMISGGYVYTAYYWDDDAGYFNAGTTAGSTPPLTTTPGDSTTDGDIDWICVGPTASLTLEMLVPDYARFTPLRVGVMAKWSAPGGSVVYPQVTFGVNGDLDKWLAATTLSKLTGDYSNHMVEPTNTEGAKQFGAEVTTFGSDLDCVAVLVFEGYIRESDVA